MSAKKNESKTTDESTNQTPSTEQVQDAQAEAQARTIAGQEADAAKGKDAQEDVETFRREMAADAGITSVPKTGMVFDGFSARPLTSEEQAAVEEARRVSQETGAAQPETTQFIRRHGAGNGA